MSTLNAVLNVINIAVPWVGVAFAFFAVLSRKVSTVDSSNAFFVHSSLLLWWLLIWADMTGEHDFVWQTAAGRFIVLVMLFIKIRVEYAATVKFIIASIGHNTDTGTDT